MLDDLTFWLAFQPVGLWLLGGVVAAAVAFLVVMLVCSYRERNRAGYPEQVAERARPVNDPPYPELMNLGVRTEVDLPTHATPRSWWA